MSSPNEDLMSYLYRYLTSQRKQMSDDIEDIRSSLVWLGSEIGSIRSVYGNEDIRSIMAKSEDARRQISQIKPEVDAIKQVLYELKSALVLPLQGRDAASMANGQAGTSQPEVQSQRAPAGPAAAGQAGYVSNYDVDSVMKKYEDGCASLRALNSEYEARTRDVQAKQAELASLSAKCEAALKELNSVRSEMESARSVYDRDEMQSMLQEIAATKGDLSGRREEKRKLEDELDAMRSEMGSARQELEDTHAKLQDARSELEAKSRDINTAKRELQFIETELAMVHEKDELRKLIRASSTLVADANSRYLEAERELKVLRKILAAKKGVPEYEGELGQRTKEDLL